MTEWNGCYKRVWAMPNKNTFEIPPIRDFISTHLYEVTHERIDRGAPGKMEIVDPFCGESVIANTRNDIKKSGIDSAIWLLNIPDNFADVVLWDPIYSPRQKKECYNNLGIHLSDTKSSYWTTLRNQITRITKPGGRVLSFGWNSVGIGTERKFKTIDGIIVCYFEDYDEVDGLIVSHGGNHNDTICKAEKKQEP
jgi:hypothetical protein